jgi:hypothetical protein
LYDAPFTWEVRRQTGGNMKSTDDLVKIASFGGGMIIDSSKSVDDLVKIASFAAGSRSRITIKNAKIIPTDDLVKIASFGKGAVVFDFTT